VKLTPNKDIVLILNHVIAKFDPPPTLGDIVRAEWLDQPWPEVDVTRMPNPLFEYITDHLMDTHIIAATKLLCADVCSNALYYPGNTMMEWHTNSDHPGRRLYYTYTEGDSSFAYIQDGKIICEDDAPGWTVREFSIPQDELFWHTIWTDLPRYSFGFRFYD
jgi:hypothetical protein